MINALLKVEILLIAKKTSFHSVLQQFPCLRTWIWRNDHFKLEKFVAVYSKVVQKSKRILCDVHQKYYGLNCFGVMSGRKKWN